MRAAGRPLDATHSALKKNSNTCPSLPPEA